jgi:hypothetical protein
LIWLVHLEVIGKPVVQRLCPLPEFVCHRVSRIILKTVSAIKKVWTGRRRERAVRVGWLFVMLDPITGKGVVIFSSDLKEWRIPDTGKLC